MSEEDYKEFKFKPILGAIPSDMIVEWWTEEDWKNHEEYVAKLKAEGKYLTEGEEVTVRYKPTDFDKFVDNRQPEERFTNFGLLVPSGAKGKIEVKYFPNKAEYQVIPPLMIRDKNDDPNVKKSSK